jgi:hypothetical protein
MKKPRHGRWIAWVLGCILVSSPAHAWAAIGELVQLSVNGPAEARLNLVILSEGYLESERDVFLRDARAVADGILQAPPLREYAGHFNVVGVFVASQESGSDHPFRGSFRNTYFNSSFDSFGIQRLITIPPNNHDSNSANGQGKVVELLAAMYPEYDLVAIVVNDSEYGGSGGRTLVVSNHSSSREIAVHELGHTLARLGDEYATANPGYPDVEEPNTTRTTVRAQVKWNAWIRASTPVPTPSSGFESVVGLFEGAHYHSTGWYRPKHDCKMRSLGVPFCEVCSEALVLSIHERLPQPPSTLPGVDTPVSISLYDQRDFVLEILPVASESARVSWALNGVPLGPSEPGLKLSLPGIALPFETNVLTADSALTTPLVRNDPLKRLSSTTRWTVVRDLLTPPRLGVEIVSEGVEFSWSALAIGFALETSRSAASGPWSGVAELPRKQGDRYRLQLPLSAERGFFRLRRR